MNEQCITEKVTDSASVTAFAERTVRVVMLSGVYDSPARAQVMSMIQFNGKCGCPICYAPGESVKTDAGHVYTYQYTSTPAQNRTNIETMTLAFEVEASLATKEKVDSLGIQGLSPLMALPKYDIIAGTGIDSMHACYQGVLKMIVNLMINKKFKNEPWFIGSKENVKEINDRLARVFPPTFIHRMPVDIAQIFNWKASEARAFALYLGKYSLNNIQKPLYLEHFMLFCDAVHLLSSDTITEQGIKNADKMLAQFCATFPALYSRRYCSSNLHSLLHLASKVRLLGPLCVQSCFFFEDLNGDLRALFHGTRNIPEQILHAVSVQYTLPKALDLFEVIDSAADKFIELVHGKKRSNYETITANCDALGYMTTMSVPNFVLPIHNQSSWEYQKFYRLRVGRFVIHCIEYNASKVHNNRIISFSFDGETSYGEVQYFIKCKHLHYSTRYYAVVTQYILTHNDLHCKNIHFEHSYSSMVAVRVGGCIVIDVNCIKKCCVIVNIDNNLYIIQPPNCIEKD